jgi:AraC-like DNA-binding protein
MQEFPKIYLYKRIVQAKLFIDAHYSEDLDLDNISTEACFSKFHFIRLFKSIYGRTPHQCLMKVRIDNAEKLLREGMSTTEACFAVGFESVTSFTALFKRINKTSPSVYQQQYMLRQEKIKDKPLHFIPGCFAAQKGWTQKSNFQEVG